MNLMKKGVSFQALLHHQSKKKHILTLIWIQEKGN